MKKFYITVAVFLYGLFSPVFCQQEWRETKSEHFAVYYRKFDRDFLDQLKSRSEELYRKITEDLGYRRFNFWTWDNRAKIYIYDDQGDFLSATGYSQWANGVSHPLGKKIESYYGASGSFFTTVLPHELGHLMLREFVGAQADVPLWFEEGVASRTETGISSYARAEVLKALKGGYFIPLQGLSAIDIRGEKDPAAVQLFYSESFEAVSFLIDRYGRDKFVGLCRDLRDGKGFEAALARNYYRKSLADLSSELIGYIKGSGN